MPTFQLLAVLTQCLLSQMDPKELKVDTFEKLKELIITEQIKKRCPPEMKDHYLDEWSKIISAEKLAEKLDAYENNRGGKRKTDAPRPGNFPPRFNFSGNVTPNRHRTNFNDRPNFHGAPLRKPDERRTLTCFGCGKVGYVKSRCPNCSPSTNHVKLYSVGADQPTITQIDILICGENARVCADTGASCTVAGERLYGLFKEKGVTMKDTTVKMSLADGRVTSNKALTADVTVWIEGRPVRTTFIILPESKGNRTLLGMDFLRNAGVVLDVRNRRWFFHDDPHHTFQLGGDLDEKNSQDSEVVLNSCDLRENEGKHLTDEQRSQLNRLLQKFKSCFEPGGEPTPFCEHRINTGNSPPVAEPPYRMTPAKKELLKKELDSLLAKGVIEECESPYASPVVLVPKPNGTVRLCIDFRKLNANTIPDTYPLPRMDDLLNEAKSTPYMSTIDLKSGYHQVEVYPPDKHKTAFVCPFGTFKFNRMPFGLRNAPATFQRLIDKFRSGLKDVFALSYLDDIIILSETFDKHIKDLETVFNRLSLFKLHANREKCHFACDRVKYLGHWITANGIEVDQEKVSAIQRIPEPTNVKEVQSFLQTCSWFRRYVPNFASIARPLSNLTKKRAQWIWGPDQQEAFVDLKKRLMSPPVLKQPDGSMPFRIRTDASSYALGAVLIQGEGPEEHVIEYASRLLSSAERNYSTTEREALAVVWALEKFRGYVENQEIIIASDHQPLKWLMSIKSPSGRLARWALQIQSFTPKIEYTPGKANFIADMLSRPMTLTEETNFTYVDLPTQSRKEIREEQLKDPDVKKIIQAFEDTEKGVDYANWTGRGYLMNDGVLFRYAPEADEEEAQLVVPCQEREKILKLHHDSPSAGHYGTEGTYQRISKRYFWSGMRSYIAEYVKNCVECCRYKPSNQKPAGLLRTPIYNQRYETIAIDLFGPLPETTNGKRWIFIVEECSTKWIELFALKEATAKECALTLLEEVFLRYGLPRRVISDNGSQFVSSIMQQVCSLLDIEQVLTPVYHPQANPVERKNRDLKPRLAILVGDDHSDWEAKLPAVRFAMNTHKSESTGHTAAFLQFGRELRTTDDVGHDLKGIIENENFATEITPYLRRFARVTSEVKERVEGNQDRRKKYADQRRRSGPRYLPGDHVWVNLHPLSKANKKFTAKFAPKRDGPYVIKTQKSFTTYEVSSLDNPDVPIGTYHSSALTPCPRDIPHHQPVLPLRKRGRPRKFSSADPGPSSGRLRDQRGSVTYGRPPLVNAIWRHN